ncbi:MAG: hypothetical protein GX446_07840 [Chthonomonadales bacterium]|nr:hypothetical protein [Chthonomonadales bacterium]
MESVWFETAPCPCGVDECIPELRVVVCPSEGDIAISIKDGRGKHSNIHLSPEWASALSAMLRQSVMRLDCA